MKEVVVLLRCWLLSLDNWVDNSNNYILKNAFNKGVSTSLINYFINLFSKFNDPQAAMCLWYVVVDCLHTYRQYLCLYNLFVPPISQECLASHKMFSVMN